MARDPQTLLRAVAVQLNRESASKRIADSPPTDDPLRLELERCRTITPEDLATDAACQAAWTENRRRFFAPVSDGREEE